MVKLVYINSRAVKLTPSQVIQSGGEGMVFEAGNMAVKIYHQLQPHHHHKLHDWMSSRLQARLPSEVYGPLALVKNGRNQTIGFQMRRLPATGQPLKRLSNPAVWKRDSHTTANIVRLFQNLHATLQKIHQQGVIVGDLNDHNIFYDLTAANGKGTSGATYWIDADSYQFGRHPCPVAMLPFVDPLLYGIDDLSLKPFFSSSTDWYAYLTLLVKCLLQTHPYGGFHRKYKTLEARATAGTSILNPAVTYPARARPVESLSDELLHHISLIFEKGTRMPFPAHLLSQYISDLITCSQCGLSYPSQRPDCPACRRQTPVARFSGDGRSFGRKVVLQVDGFIEYVSIQPSGRILTVVRTGSSYRLVRVGIGGQLSEMKLFNGHASYRFGSFSQPGCGHYLVVNPAHGNQLLIMDVAGRRPKQVAVLETKNFQGAAVFATSPTNLFRIAGNLIMRGSVNEGKYLEDIIATAHKDQTMFWASPFGNILAGYHQVFAERRYFIIDSQNTNHELSIPPSDPGESITETAFSFGRESLAITVTIMDKGRPRIDTYLGNFHGDLLYTLSRSPDLACDGNNRLSFPFTTDLKMPVPPFLLLPGFIILTGGERFHIHPGGVLIQEPHCLSLTGKNNGLDKVY